ncbi:Acyl-CoA ligase sidI [Fulvia fulva]|nr:Acyl-CoA ligase sidI [Fulvia fulva]
MGVRKGDVVGVMAGNCQEHIDIFSSAARIGAPVASMHATFTLDELCGALASSTCKVLFIATKIGKRDTSALIEMAGRLCNEDSNLEHVITIGEPQLWSETTNYQVWQTFLQRSESVFIDEALLIHFAQLVSPTEPISLQFTSGTMGNPKLATLTHFNILNNALFMGNAMDLCSRDVLCCPAPLSHCSGLVVGFLNALVHGTMLVLPSQVFEAERTVDALVQERCTAIIGVPTMYLAELEVLKTRSLDKAFLRTGLIAGANVAPALMERIYAELGAEAMLIAYGMTETGPITFCFMDNEGYCYVSGRLKDIIIRGGQNIYPAEIEERLLQLPTIAEAVVVEIREWIRETLGRHKAPKHIFWVGVGNGLASIPKTGSGKPAKHELRKIALELLQDINVGQARL